MKYWVIQRSVRFTTSMVKMHSRKEWVLEVEAMTPSISSNPSLVEAHLEVYLTFRNNKLYLKVRHSANFPEQEVITAKELLRQCWKLEIEVLNSFWIIFILLGLIGGGSSRGRRQRRGEDVVHPLKVSLEELYNGTSKKLSLSRNIICSKCSGSVIYLYFFTINSVCCTSQSLVLFHG